MDWKDYCPIGEDEPPVKRQAWRGGWEYCMEHGPGVPDRSVVGEMGNRPALLSVWLEGYSAADHVLRNA